MSKPKLLQRASAVIENSQLPIESGAVQAKVNEFFNGEAIVANKIASPGGGIS